MNARHMGIELFAAQSRLPMYCRTRHGRVLPAGSQRRAVQAEPGQRLACCRGMHGLGIGPVESCGRLVGQPAHAPQALFGRLLHGLQHGRHILGSMGLQYALGLAKAMLQTGSTRLPGSGEIKNGFQVRSPASALSICAECYQTCYIHQPGIAGIKKRAEGIPQRASTNGPPLSDG